MYQAEYVPLLISDNEPSAERCDCGCIDKTRGVKLIIVFSNGERMLEFYQSKRSLSIHDP